MLCIIKSTSLLTLTFCVDKRVISLIMSINFSLDLSYSAEVIFSMDFIVDSILFNSADLFDKSSPNVSNCLRSFNSLLFKKITAVSFVTRLSSYNNVLYSCFFFLQVYHHFTLSIIVSAAFAPPFQGINVN